MEEAGTEAQEVRGASARAGARAGGCLESGLQGEGRNQGEAESRKGERSKSWGMSRSIIRLVKERSHCWVVGNSVHTEAEPNEF